MTETNDNQIMEILRKDQKLREEVLAAIFDDACDGDVDARSLVIQYFKITFVADAPEENK